MIKTNDLTLQLLQELATSKYQFHLTGSRFFRTNHPRSDWDFLVEYQPGLSLWLISRGFAIGREYSDCSVSQVYGIYGIHIQEIKPIFLQKKLRIQEFLRSNDITPTEEVWNALLSNEVEIK